MLSVCAAEESDFSFAMSQYYNDTIACMGALQIAPSFMKSYVEHDILTFHGIIIDFYSFVYSLITRKGRALDILLTRMLDAVDPKHSNWEENENLRRVSLYFILRIQDV